MSNFNSLVLIALSYPFSQTPTLEITLEFDYKTLSLSNILHLREEGDITI